MLPSPEELKNPPFYHEMILVEGGIFMMGSEEKVAQERERPVHKVELSAFFIAKYPVTQAIWQAVMGDNPSHFKEDSRPVEQVSWDDAQEFVHKIKALTNQKYRLPTEAEWEFAARGGMATGKYKYAGSNLLDELAWYCDNSQNETKPVGLKQPNELGLYDMSGNVWEWCSDRYNDYHSKSQTNPQGPKKGLIRVFRGGSWAYSPSHCRPSCRMDTPSYFAADYLGFRLACSL